MPLLGGGVQEGGEQSFGQIQATVPFSLPQSGNKVSLRTTALENTSIKVGPARKNSSKTRMARRSKKSRKRDSQDRWVTMMGTLGTSC